MYTDEEKAGHLAEKQNKKLTELEKDFKMFLSVVFHIQERE